jgi:hypothetical protein
MERATAAADLLSKREFLRLFRGGSRILRIWRREKSGDRTTRTEITGPSLSREFVIEERSDEGSAGAFQEFMRSRARE